MATYYPSVPFERYADDVIVHCRTEWQAKAIRKAIAKRLLDCELELHPEKTRIIYCKDDLRKGRHTMRSSIFLRSNSVRGSRSIATEKSSPISVPRSRPKLPSRCGQSSATGACGNAVVSFGRSFPPLQSDSPGLVPILRQVLPYRALLGDPPTGSRAGQLGQTEIQETA